MTTLTLVLFILLLPLCLFLIGLILLQGGAGDISSAFGGGGQLDSTLGVGAGRKMSKITGWLSATFMAIVLLLSIQHAGDFGKAAGPSTKPAVIPIGNDGQGVPATPPGTTPPVNITPQAPAIAPVPGTAPAPTAPTVTPAVEQPAAPVAPTTPSPAAEKPVEQPAAPAATPAPATQPAPVAPQPAPTTPAPAAPTAEKPVEQPAAPAAQPAPAAPRSGITLDEPAK